MEQIAGAAMVFALPLLVALVISFYWVVRESIERAPQLKHSLYLLIFISLMTFGDIAIAANYYLDDWRQNAVNVVLAVLGLVFLLSVLVVWFPATRGEELDPHSFS